MTKPNFEVLTTLKIDEFSTTYVAMYNGRKVIVRSFNEGRFVSRIIARWLARRELKILKKLNSLESDNFPRLLYNDQNYLIRSYLEGKPLVEAGDQPPAFYAQALEHVAQMHSICIIHNDLEKPENWIVQADGSPGIIDFQISIYMPFTNNYFFRRLSFEDVRHTLKNKRRYCTEPLSDAEEALYNKRSALNKIWRYGFKSIYNFVTRKIFNYSDRAASKYSK